ncbi:MAG: hypothetical protein GX988_02900 [Clostridiales bacterium]|nr:hypothetical protein [Clostridiales bacterium]
MNSLTVKIIGFFLSAFIIINVASQIYHSSYVPYEFEVAIPYTLSDSIEFNAAFIREEVPITYNGKGVISYPYDDGSRIGSDAVVANVYKNDEDALRSQIVRENNEEIDRLEKSHDRGATDVTQLDTVGKLIDERYIKLMRELETGNLEGVGKEKKELQILLNTMNIITGKNTDYSERITALKSQTKKLLNQIEKEPIPITTEKAGHFVSFCDGYEHLNAKKAKKLTIDELNDIFNDTGRVKTDDAIGKIVTDYEFLLIGVITTTNDQAFLIGKEFEMQIDSVETPTKVAVQDIKKVDDDNSIITLEIDTVRKEFMKNRIADCELFLDTYSGVRIPKQAIRFYEEEKGVFVRVGNNMVFKPVDPIYEGENYVICARTDEKNSVFDYDELIIEGKDLYDKKPIK